MLPQSRNESGRPSTLYEGHTFEINNASIVYRTLAAENCFFHPNAGSWTESACVCEKKEVKLPCVTLWLTDRCFLPDLAELGYLQLRRT
ncbi:MAG: hypothetical protein H6Q30_189 [Bacteroidetes bacterium]|nr:hypothetical protein [Bacteroidota bacterium]